MIRGPVLPKMRDSLWELVSARLDAIESGLELALESFECGDPALGVVEGIARDAAGGPVLVMLAVEGDTLLSARALAADRFLQRVGAALPEALPEANFSHGQHGRLLVVGTESSASLLQQLCELPLHGLEACSLEPFRVAGEERFAVRWLARGGVLQPVGVGQDDAEAAPLFCVPRAQLEVWEELHRLCRNIDPEVVVTGDRFSRRVTWSGYLLGEVFTSDGVVVGRSATGLVLALRGSRDVRRFGDQLLRAFAQRARLDMSARPAADPVRDANARKRAVEPSAGRAQPDGASSEPAAPPRQGAHAGAGESLRTSLAASRLTPEEHSALGEPVASTDSQAEGSVAEVTKPTSPQ
jgi:hypothetical protein